MCAAVILIAHKHIECVLGGGVQSGDHNKRIAVQMKKRLLLSCSICCCLVVVAGLAVSANAQTTALNEWTWVGGSHSIPQFGN